MKKHLLLLTLLSPCGAFAQTWTQIGLDIDGEAAYDGGQMAVSMPDPITVAFGAPENDGNGTAAGRVRVFEWSGSAWVQKGSSLDGEAPGDRSGCAVSMPDANTVAVGANYNDANGPGAGHVRVYAWSGSAWIQKGVDIDGEGDYDESGGAVSMPDDNTVAIGATGNIGNGPGAGHVRVYAWDGSAWGQKGVDIDGEAAGDNSGRAVSMPDANTVAIGAAYNEGNGFGSGHVRIYAWDGSAWLQKGGDIDGEAAGDVSGAAVSMPDANTVAIGARFNSGNGPFAGHVRVYEWSGVSWLQKGSDLDGEASEDYSGGSVSMPDQNTVAIGAPGDDGNGSGAGHVRVYEWNGSAWSQKGADLDGEAPEDGSGYPVSMPTVDIVAIGAAGNLENDSIAGQVRVFGMPVTGMLEGTASALEVWPNPTSGPLTVELGKARDKLAVSVTNALGQEIIRLHLNRATEKFTLSLDGPSGVYLVNVITANGTVARVKVLKQ